MEVLPGDRPRPSTGPQGKKPRLSRPQQAPRPSPARHALPLSGIQSQLWQAAAREGNSSGRQASHGDSRRCAHGPRGSQAEGLEPPSPSRAPGALSAAAPAHFHVSVTCWESHNISTLPPARRLPLTRLHPHSPSAFPEGPPAAVTSGLAPMCGFGGRHSIQPTARGHGQGPGKSWGASRPVGQSASSLRDHT